MNLFKGTKCSSYQIWGPKSFKVAESLRINVGAFITFFKAIYFRDVFNRRGHLLEVHFLNIRPKFIRTLRLRTGLVFYNISWSTKFELERTLLFKRADRKMNFKHYFRDRVALALPKLTHKKEHFRLSQELLALLKKVCNTVIVEVVIIHIWTVWIIQIKGSKTG